MTVNIERDKTGAWLASLEEEPRVHTYARSLSKLLPQLRDAAALWFEVPVDEIDVIRVRFADDPALGDAVQDAADARRALEDAQAKAASAMRHAVELLVEQAGVSTRDAAALLGVSHQRVHQIAQG